MVHLDLLLHTKGMSDYLQQDDLDFVAAIDMVQLLVSIFSVIAASMITMLKHSLNAKLKNRSFCL